MDESHKAYVAAMKGVILSINPQARLIDLSHALPPQDLRHAAFFLVVHKRLPDEPLISREVSRQPGDTFLFHVTLKHFFLQGDIDAHVPVLPRLIAVIESKEE